MQKDPISSFKTWNTEVDNLTLALGTQNRATAELIVAVFNSKSGSGSKGFIKDQINSLEDQAKEVNKYHESLLKNIKDGIETWTKQMVDNNIPFAQQQNA